MAMRMNEYDLPLVGQVELEHCLVEYDGPRLFTVKAANGGRYLGYWAVERDRDSVYWYSAISDERYERLLKGEIGIRSVFAEPESGYILQVVWDDARQQYRGGQIVPSNELDRDALPEADFRLADEVGANILFPGVIGTSNFLALQLRRLVLRLRFAFEQHEHEAPAALVGSAMTSLQETLDAIGQALSGQPTERGPINDAITSKTALNIRNVFPGSFGIELAADESSDLFGDSLAGRSLETLMQLLESEDDTERLRAQLLELHGRTARRYRGFIQALAEAGTDVAIDSGVPKAQGSRSLLLRRDRIPSIVDALYYADPQAPRLLEFVAELIGYNKRTRSFELQNIVENKRYTGKVTGIAVEMAKRAVIGDEYRVRIAETSDYEPVLEKEIIKYELVSMDWLRARPVQVEVPANPEP
jgi:hypothetical protein